MKSKIVHCIDCGKEYPRKELNQKLRCPDCAWKACGDAGSQMFAKEGPYYDRWLRLTRQIPDDIEARAGKMKQRYIESRKWLANKR